MPRSRSILLLVLLLILGHLGPACTGLDSSPTGNSSTTAYDVRGRIVQIMPDSGTLTVEHEAISGYMAAMTMEFRSNTPDAIEGLKVGDAVQFRYVVSNTDTWIEEIERRPDHALAEHPARDDAPARMTPSEHSIYQLDGDWTTQSGRRVHLSTFQGQPVMVAMIFTHCSYACPMIVQDMKAIARALPDDLSDRVHRVLVSIDPARDTPKALAQFATAHQLSPDLWTLLRAPSTDVRTLAALLGVRYKPEADGQFAHTNLITLLNAQGEIVHQQDGLGHGATKSAETLRTILTPAS